MDLDLRIIKATRVRLLRVFFIDFMRELKTPGRGLKSQNDDVFCRLPNQFDYHRFEHLKTSYLSTINFSQVTSTEEKIATSKCLIRS